jgi:predicted nuclease of predicted toxin-antitoxin system
VAIEGLWIRPYLDHNVHLWLADALRCEGYDIVVAREVGNARASDEEHLRWATERGRTVVTYDRTDFPRLNRQWRTDAQTHAGIIVSVAPPRLPASVVVRRLLRVLDAVTADEMVNRLLWLDHTWDTDVAER